MRQCNQNIIAVHFNSIDCNNIPNCKKICILLANIVFRYILNYAAIFGFQPNEILFTDCNVQTAPPRLHL